MIEIWIMRIVVGLLITLVLYMLKLRDNRFNKLEDKVNDNEHNITKINGKLWSEDKLRIIVREAVKNALNEFKILLFEEGVLPTKEKKK